MKLYTFFRSGTSHRLRIALNLKGLAYEPIAVDLRREQHLKADYKVINPQQFVPALDIDGQVMTQSPAIIEWLEECHPDPPLLPSGASERAQVRAAVDRLPEGLRQVVILAYFQGLKYRDVAAALDIPVGTVKSRLHAALARLTQEWMAAQESEDGSTETTVQVPNV